MSKHDGQASMFPERPPDVSGARSVMFVCLGNICRSPTAQGVVEHLAVERGVREQLRIASSGTGDWHVGDLPDPRTMQTALDNGVKLSSRAMQLAIRHFQEFDLLLAMDRRNYRDIIRLGCPKERVALFMSFAPAKLAATCNYEVPDPYTGGPAEFQRVFTLVKAGAEGLLDAMFARPS